jgi:hypothetical protein
MGGEAASETPIGKIRDNASVRAPDEEDGSVAGSSFRRSFHR